MVKYAFDEDDDEDDGTAALGLGLLPPDIQAATTWEVAVTNIKDEIFGKYLGAGFEKPRG